MSDPVRERTTRLLNAAARGDRAALDEVWSRVCDDLRGIADGVRARKNDPPSVNTTLLLHEAFTPLFHARTPPQWDSESQFYAYAAKVMQSLLNDHLRWTMRLKRGGDRERVPLDERIAAKPRSDAERLALGEALESLERSSPRAAQVIRLRVYGGRTVADTARYLDISPRTVESDFQFARARLWEALRGDAESGDQGETFGVS